MIMFLMCGVAVAGLDGPYVNDILDATGDTSIAVASTDTVYTRAFSLKWGEYFGLSLKATSDASVDVNVELEQSWQVPTTEGASDSNWAEPEGMSDLINVTDETVHIMGLSPKPFAYGRLKMTGQGSNSGTTTVRARLSKQEQN